MDKEETKGREKNTVKEYFQLGEVFRYYFRKKDPKKKLDVNTRMMHGINKISIVIFLAAIIFLIIRNIFWWILSFFEITVWLNQV